MAFSDADVMRWWNTPLRVEVADTRRDLVNSLNGEDAHMWVVHEAGQPVGLVGLLGDVAVPGLSWLLCRQAWGRGLMAEAAGAVVEHAFGSLGLARVEAWVEAANVRSHSNSPPDWPDRIRPAGATVSAPRATTRDDRSG